MKQKLNQRLLAFLKQGITPHKLAMTFTLGLVIGTFPAIGLTTVLCTAAALFFRLNMPAMQLVNYLTYPLQLILFVPFAELGASFLNLPEHAISFTELSFFSAEGIALLWDNLSKVMGSAALAWAVVMLPTSILSYFAFLRFFKRIKSLQTA